MKRQATAAEKKYMGRIASMSCACCGVPGPVELHHVREGQGLSQKSSNYLVIPLCVDCHRNQKLGIHGEKINWKIRKINELDALASTIKLLFDR